MFFLTGCGKRSRVWNRGSRPISRAFHGGRARCGRDAQQAHLFSCISAEARVPDDHPLRPIRKMVDRALVALSPKFQLIYSAAGRPGIPPERLLRVFLLQVLYTVRSERLLMERLNYNLLFRWFVGQSMDDAVWDVTVFSKNRERLLEGEVARAFFEAVLAQARAAKLLSDEHFTVDGTLGKPAPLTRASTVKAPSTGAPSTIPVMRSAYANASASKRFSVGSKPQVCRAKQDIEALSVWAGCILSPWRLTTW